MHLRRFVTTIVVVLLLSTLLAGLVNATAAAVTGSGSLAATSNTSTTAASTKPNSTSGVQAVGTTTTKVQGSVVGASAASSGKKYVVFRDDDIGVGSLDTLKAINQVHIDENVPKTLAIIPNFANATEGSQSILQEPLYSYLQSIKGNSLFEFAQHGYTHINHVEGAAGTLVQASQFPGKPYADLVGQVDTRSEFRGRPYGDQYNDLKQGKADITAAFGVTPTIFVPPFNTGDDNTLRALKALNFTLYSTSPDDFGVQEANLQGIMVQGEQFGLGWENDTQWSWRMQNLTQYTDAALNAAAPGDSIVIYYHYWTFNNPDGSPDATNIALLKQYIEHLKSRGDVLFTTLGGQHFLGGGWSAWASLGGQLASGTSPATCAQDANTLDAFVQGTDNALWYKQYQVGSGWSGWETLGGVLSASPAAVSQSAGKIDVFVRGSDGALWTKSTTNGGSSWSGWSKIGGQLLAGTGPAAYAWGDTRIGWMVTGTDNQLWHMWTDSSGTHTWQSLGGVLTSSPAATSSASGAIDVFVRGSDGGPWQREYSNNAWGGWAALGGQIASGTGPAASSWGAGRLDVFVQGTDNVLWHKWYTGKWSGWESIDGALTSSPAATSRWSGTIDVFVRGDDGALSYGLWRG